MSRKGVREGIVGLGLLTGLLLATHPAAVQSMPASTPQATARPSPQSATGPASLADPTPYQAWQPMSEPIDPIQQLVRMRPEELDRLYQQAAVGAIPAGKARGRAIFRPGTAMAPFLSRATKVAWQGKVFNPADATAVNRFFGLRMIRGNLYYGESWMDGKPALILDYSDTSLVYANYRDEIREVVPGLYLGLMYARTSPQPTFKIYFALQVP